MKFSNEHASNKFALWGVQTNLVALYIVLKARLIFLRSRDLGVAGFWPRTVEIRVCDEMRSNNYFGAAENSNILYLRRILNVQKCINVSCTNNSRQYVFSKCARSEIFSLNTGSGERDLTAMKICFAF
jgi:hypothetical protein